MENITSVGRWKFEKSLGQGSYGVVKRAEHSHTRQKSAIKIVDTNKLKKPSERVALRREVSVHYTLKHKNIVEVSEVFERNGFIFIVMDLLEGGDLFSYIVDHGKMEEEKGRNLFIQMLNAITYCHNASIVHRDLKLENFLLNKDATQVKLTDFGFCNVMKEGTLLETFCGSPYYCAPEIFLAQKYEGRPADIWSLGVILYSILTGSLPFVNPQGKVMFDKLMAAECPYPSHLSSGAVSVIKSMLKAQPSQRATISELMRHPWVVCGINKATSVPPSLSRTVRPATYNTIPLSNPAPPSPLTSRSHPTTSSLMKDKPSEAASDDKDPKLEKQNSNEKLEQSKEERTSLSDGAEETFIRPRNKPVNRSKRKSTLGGTWRRVTDTVFAPFFQKSRTRDLLKEEMEVKKSDDEKHPSATGSSSSGYRSDTAGSSSSSGSSSANSSTSSSGSSGSGCGSGTNGGNYTASVSPQIIIRDSNNL